MSRGFWWRKDAPSDELEAMRCEECGELHCYWCGLEFVLRGGSRWAPCLPSREHLDARRDDRGRVWRGERIVAAHAACNNARGIAPWAPFHSAVTKPKGQRKAEQTVRQMLDRWREAA